MRKAVVAMWLGILSIIVLTIFWRVEWIYSLPTPVPKNYVGVQTGQQVHLARSISLQSDRPVLLHFFNPDCPCSKFNAAHFRSIVALYGKKVNIIIVPVSKKDYSVQQIQDFYQVKVPVLLDSSLASKCGVYSTPQAVILNTDHTLYYRGNYNKSRYCTSKKTEYAVLALDSLLTRKHQPHFDRYALTAYGCEIPVIKTNVLANQ